MNLFKFKGELGMLESWWMGWFVCARMNECDMYVCKGIM